MPDNPAEQRLVAYTPEFKRNLRTLAKKYRHIQFDLQPVIGRLQAGEVVGDQVPATRHTVFKVRIQNTDLQKGKRSGYRLLYWLKSPSSVVLVTIYSKLDQGDISTKEIQRILAQA